MAGFSDLLQGIGGGIGNLFKGGAKTVGNIGNAIGSGLQNFGQKGFGGAPAAAASGASGGSSGMFSNPGMGLGLATLFGSQLIGNPKPPALPDSFNQFQQQANAGGPPIQQQSNQYMQGILNNTNTSANDAATHSLDLNYQEQLRQLNGMYKSLRPGSDPTSDTTYQRDLNNLNDMYARQRAQVLSQQQQGAAQYGLQAGQAQAGQQADAVNTQVSQLGQQWNMDAQKKAALRNMLMEMGGLLTTGPTLANLFNAGRK